MVLLLRKEKLWRVVATMRIAGAASPIGTDLQSGLAAVLCTRLVAVIGMVCVELLCMIEALMSWRLLRVVVDR